MRWVRKSEPNAEYGWTSNEIAREIMEAVEESQPEPQRTVTLLPEDPRYEVGRHGSDVESCLRVVVESVLVDEYGNGDWGNSDWFIHGIPLPVQRKCFEKRIEARSDEPPLNFATLVEFLDVIDSKNWLLFEGPLRSVGFKERKQFKSDYLRFNSLRNLTHGAREQLPSPEDLEFAGMFSQRISDLRDALAE